MTDAGTPTTSAPQQRRAPRPLPLFLELVRQASQRDPDLARRSLAGLEAYQRAPRAPARTGRPAVARVGGACLRDHGGDGAPVVLVPSLINPPHILDLDPDVSLAARLVAAGHQVLLVDWGSAAERASLDVDGHIETLLLPLLDAVGEPASLVGYCLGGTMALAAGQLVPARRVATLAAPWHFDLYLAGARSALDTLWQQSEDAATALGALPTEVLQAAFWALDPERTVRKYADFAALPPDCAEAVRFVSLEDWANEGEALPLPAARALFEQFFRDNRPGRGAWRVGGQAIAPQPPVPALHFVAGSDCIVPPETAPDGDRIRIDSGHVGMIVGRARSALHSALEDFLAD